MSHGPQGERADSIRKYTQLVYMLDRKMETKSRVTRRVFPPYFLLWKFPRIRVILCFLSGICWSDPVLFLSSLSTPQASPCPTYVVRDGYRNCAYETPRLLFFFKIPAEVPRRRPPPPPPTAFLNRPRPVLQPSSPSPALPTL